MVKATYTGEVEWLIGDTMGRYQCTPGTRPSMSYNPANAYHYGSLEIAAADCLALFRQGNDVVLKPVRPREA